MWRTLLGATFRTVCADMDMPILVEPRPLLLTEGQGMQAHLVSERSVMQKEIQSVGNER